MPRRYTTRSSYRRAAYNAGLAVGDSYINIALNISGFISFEFGDVPGKNLEEALAKVFDPSVVYFAKATPYGNGESFMIIIKNAAEMDDPGEKKQLIAEVVKVAKRSLVKSLRKWELVPSDIRVTIFEDVYKGRDPHHDLPLGWSR